MDDDERARKLSELIMVEQEIAEEERKLLKLGTLNRECILTNRLNQWYEFYDVVTKASTTKNKNPVLKMPNNTFSMSNYFVQE